MLIVKASPQMHLPPTGQLAAAVGRRWSVEAPASMVFQAASLLVASVAQLPCVPAGQGVSWPYLFSAACVSLSAAPLCLSISVPLLPPCFREALPVREFPAVKT